MGWIHKYSGVYRHGGAQKRPGNLATDGAGGDGGRVYEVVEGEVVVVVDRGVSGTRRPGQV